MRVTKEWFKGSADAIFQNIDIIEAEKPEYILVFGAEHIYQMDISKMFSFHIEKGADLTISTIDFPESEFKRYGILAKDSSGRVVHYIEKPSTRDMIFFDSPVASMGNFIFKKDVLINAVIEDSHDDTSTHDLSRDIIPKTGKDAQGLCLRFQVQYSAGYEREREGLFQGCWYY
jgi:glucose-1-phosphate adenylyltransferase